jgi:AsmA protein
MGARLGRTAIASNLRNGVLAVTIGEAQAFGGILRGAVGLGKGAAGAELKAQLQFNDVDLESCLGEFFAIRRLEGKGNLALNVEGSGTSLFDITRTLSGEASLAARQGALSGLNIEQALRRFERQPLSGGSELRSGQTPFDKLSIVVKFAQGIATVEQVQFESPRVRLAVAGSASIPARDLNLKGIASLIAGGPADRGGAFQLPFVVQGRWDDPIMLPDAESLIRHSRAAGPLLDAVKGRSARDLVRSAIDQLTRGAAPAAPAKPGIVAPTASSPAPQAPAPR